MSAAELTLRSGRTIRLRALEQHDVYAGLLEGLPTRERNALLVDRTVEKAKKPSILLRPEETAIDHTRWPFGTPAKLPSICSVSHFESRPVRRDADLSWLTVIWFQDDFGFPPTGEVFEQLLSIEWDRHAEDGFF